MIDWQELLVRLLVASALGAVIGFERERRARDLGLRTHTLGALAAATFTVVSLQFVHAQPPGYGEAGGDLLQVDVSRIAAAVVVGVGFLAGGTILRVGTSLRGLTTAAGVWLVSAIGMCAGAGMFRVAAVATGLGLFTLVSLRWVEGEATREARIHVMLGALEQLQALREALDTVARSVRVAGYETERDGSSRVVVILDIEHGERTSVDAIIAAVDATADARCTHVTTPELEV